MKKQYKYVLATIACLGSLISCEKGFLDEKPSSTIITPSTLSDYKNLLDNYSVVNVTGALPQLSADDYDYTNQAALNSVATNTARNAYLWRADIYQGERNIQDWNGPYQAIFYANSVIDGITKIPRDIGNASEWDNLMGWALFVRAYEYFDLVRNFSPAYEEASAAANLGVPIRLSPGIDILLQRASQKETYERILLDLNTAKLLLNGKVQANNRNRPSAAAVSGLLSRIYLSMRMYDLASFYAEECLATYSTIIDYNTVSTTARTPFSYNNDETIYSSVQVAAFSGATSNNTSTSIYVNKELIASYQSNDLRLPIFFAKNTAGNYNKKRGYAGEASYPFTGIATDEIILNLAECKARKGDPQGAMTLLNSLLVKRWNNKVVFTPLKANDGAEALKQILNERRKELVWRGLRWTDIKRLNVEGRNIALTRNINNEVYTLNPNDPKYVFPIPDDEILLSGITQNTR
ncbi:RagB/SusD family nutrient uptake outer membrane protein [Pedobacter frigidisoli]|uniref:RagB/SusD family nutrient uptake outer membrane protein n=1 Tax=Pedobacter frigidisoli TaxID=2530455 RepID=UPI00292EC5E8|nr:RagB/SusD family nutrient uptake outer membrane protein [Pedobacter frigidisoli]